MENKTTRRSQDSKNKMSQSINCREAVRISSKCSCREAESEEVLKEEKLRILRSHQRDYDGSFIDSDDLQRVMLTVKHDDLSC